MLTGVGALERQQVRSPGRELLDAACSNARTLARLCDVIEAGPAGPDELHQEQQPRDGAFILPEEL